MTACAFLFASGRRKKRPKTRGSDPRKKSVVERERQTMKREEIKQIFPDATDEQLKSVMDLNGADVERAKAKTTKLEEELLGAKDDFKKLNAEFEALKASNASAEDWQAKFEALQADNVAKEKQAEADRILAEKSENVRNRFNAVLGEKKFNHDAIKDAYLKKFGDALESKDFEGKSDADIFHALTKDDATAFVGVTAVNLGGGTPQGIGKQSYGSKADIMAIKDRDARQKAIAENITLFEQKG